MDYTFQWRVVARALPSMLQGAGVTLELAASVMLLGTLIALLLMFAKTNGPAYLEFAATCWIETARNTPALFQIYIIYFGFGSIGIIVDSYTALLIGITFNNAGYLSETFRGALCSVPLTQLRAGRSLGMGAIRANYYIILPQVLKAAFPALTNQMVWSILMTSLGVMVGLSTDLTGVTQDLNVRSFRTIELFVTAAALYFLMSKAFTLTARLLARRLFLY